MPADRYFTETSLSPKVTVRLEGQELHHLLHVMRAKEGDEVELVNGRGQFAKAIVRGLSRHEASLVIYEVVVEAPPTKKLILAQAIPRINRLDFILEKGTELGMTDLWLFPSELGERKKIEERQLGHMHAVTVAAMKQCGRLFLPNIAVKSHFSKWENITDRAFFGDVSRIAPSLIEAWRGSPAEGNVMFFIGPESGFTEAEEKVLCRLGCEGVKLHNNVLRTDTAALAALALINHLMTYSVE